MGNGQHGALIGFVRSLAAGDAGVRSGLRDAILHWIDTAPVGPCVRHPLGFLHHEIAREDSLSLRLHVWSGLPRPVKAPLDNAHDHIWHLTSVILTGEIANIVLDVSADEEGPTHGVFKVEYDGLRNVMVPQPGLVRVRETGRRIYRSGDAYTLPAGVFHDVDVPAGGVTATLVIADRGPEPSPRVLSVIRQPPCEMVRPLGGPGELAGSLRAIAGHLMSAPEWAGGPARPAA